MNASSESDSQDSEGVHFPQDVLFTNVNSNGNQNDNHKPKDSNLPRGNPQQLNKDAPYNSNNKNNYENVILPNFGDE